LKKLSEKAKKNLLDLNHNKYLQYFNTTIIIVFTYIVGILIGFITGGLNYKDKNVLILVVLISIGILSVSTLFLLNFKKHQENIKEELRKLKI